jgi:hypothetical protein
LGVLFLPDLKMVGMLALSLLIAQAAAMGGFSGKMKFKH